MSFDLEWVLGTWRFRIRLIRRSEYRTFLQSAGLGVVRRQDQPGRSTCP